MWSFEQEHGLGFTNVATNIRMTVIRLAAGGLWVHAPVAPTPECLAALRRLGGEVEHLVLPTFAYEHKIYLPPMTRRFPAARVWVAPSQWTWPLPLPLPLLGVFNAEVLDEAAPPPWADELPLRVLGPAGLGPFPFTEVAFFHAASKTLLVTDAVVSIPSTPPAVLAPSAVETYARNNIFVRLRRGARGLAAAAALPAGGTDVADADDRALRGWQRIVLLVLYFVPFDLIDPGPAFAATTGRLVVAPVVRILVFPSIRHSVRRWVDAICGWEFTSVLPAHFEGPVPAGPAEFRDAFTFLEGAGDTTGDGVPAEAVSYGSPTLPAKDRRALDALARGLRRVGVVKPE
ncbi:hypothetical protein BU14_0457s0019 [Porphyra umbilicalis]|uniref:DUF4336 domain-containing protein n=1 Tax=Porphyra umbilicalis TaxID=2786 RepID=A0A1X6NUP6_PORUM|nr:hypothetical protein BU14_0457s0019 [Porphyra umbilicalis]|eukprot:OSX72226.1 hypothetical protein BU14_0457s0019 [Porphyra umbilicalis]